jgi:hypothetical protein
MDEPISAVTYPVIVINGVSYPVKFGNASFYRLEKSGLDLNDVAAKLRSRKLGLAMVYDLLAASVGNGFTGEQLAEVVPINEARDIVIAALGKVPPPAETALREPAAPSPVTQ